MNAYSNALSIRPILAGSASHPTAILKTAKYMYAKNVAFCSNIKNVTIAENTQ